jgi:hypothetical protein
MRSASRRPRLWVEPLEARHAPASVFSFTDVDGDRVRITSSVGDLNAPMVAITAPDGLGVQLQVLRLTGAEFRNADVTTSVTRALAGDGLVHIGRIVAGDLGRVTIRGDLGAINCGDPDTATPAIRLLQVSSMGRFGLATQGGVGDLTSSVNGTVVALHVTGDVVGTRFTVSDDPNHRDTVGSLVIDGSLIGGGKPSTGFVRAGRIGTIRIGGSLVGTDADGTGVISAREIQSIRIAGALTNGLAFPSLFSISGGLFGAMGSVWVGGDVSGAIGGSVREVRIGGNLVGGEIWGRSSAEVPAGIGSVSIAGNMINANIRCIGVRLTDSITGGDIGSVRIGGNLIGATNFIGGVNADGSIGRLNIGGSIVGGTRVSFTWSTDPDGLVHEGQVFARGSIGPVRIGGDVVGGRAVGLGTIRSNESIGPVSIGGNLVGGDGMNSGSLIARVSVAGTRVGGKVQGGAGDLSGQITSNGDVGPVTVSGAVAGGAGFASGSVVAGGALTRATVESVTGGTGIYSGRIAANTGMGKVTVRHSLTGGAGLESGAIHSFAGLAGVKIGGSVRGGAGSFTGMILAESETGAVVIGGDLVGGSATGQSNVTNSGLVMARGIGSLTLGGSLIAGTDNTSGMFLNNGAIRAGDGGLASVLIRGNVIGNSTNPVVISAAGRPGKSDPSIGTLRVLGRVEFGQILAGYERDGNGANADARIGTIAVGGDFVASSIVAGVGAGPNRNFGDSDDAKLSGPGFDDPQVISRIDRVMIGGRVRGTDVSGDHYGIVAEEAGAVTIGVRPVPLHPGGGNDTIVVPPTDDFRLYEI